MNNQAAQTMPELPRPEWTARKSQTGEYAELVPEGWEDEMWAYGTVRAYTADQMHQYARDYALSQTAGVVPLEPWERTSMETLAAALRGRGDDLSTDSASWMEKWLAAAPAASGGEANPSTCIHRFGHDGRVCLRCGWNFRENGDPPQPPSAASVSERARAMLAAEFDGIGMHGVANDVRMNKLAVIDKAIIRALEQALTQQRVAATECVCPAGSGCTRPCDRGWRRILSEARVLPPSSRGNIIDFIEREMEQATTPQPGAEALRELVQRWRGVIEGAEALGYSEQEADVMRLMTDELESLLGRGGK